MEVCYFCFDIELVDYMNCFFNKFVFWFFVCWWRIVDFVVISVSVLDVFRGSDGSGCYLVGGWDE